MSWRIATWAEKDHSKAQGNICIYLRTDYPTLCTLIALRLRVSATRCRVPDVCVSIGEPDEEVPTQPPFLCIEILSPEDGAGRIQRKVGDYLKMGVRYIFWVIEPREREAVIYTTSGTHVVEDGFLRASDPDIAVPLAEIFD